MAQGTGRTRKKPGPKRKIVLKPTQQVVQDQDKALAYRAAGWELTKADERLVKPLPTTTARKTLEYAASKINGGKKQFIEYCRMASVDVPEIIPFLEFWDSQSSYVQGKWPLDQFAFHSNVPWPKIIGAAVAAAAAYNADVSDMVAMASMPDVVATSVRKATDPDDENGHKDRELLMKHANFLPVPKGSVINVNNTAQAAANATAGAGIKDFSDTIMDTADVVRDAWSPDQGEVE